MRDTLRVTRRIYGPGPTRRSRVLLAVPGRDYPSDFVLAVTNGDRALIGDPAPAEVVVADHGLSTLDRRPPKVVVADEDGGGTDDANGEEDDEDDTSPVVDLAKLDKPALEALAAERGVELPARATKVQIIGALQAADQTGD